MSDERAGPASRDGLEVSEGRVTVGDGVELDYRFDGPEAASGAPVLVLAHSIGTSRALFAPVVRSLAKTFRVLRYDARGHGVAPTRRRVTTRSIGWRSTCSS